MKKFLIMLLVMVLIFTVALQPQAVFAADGDVALVEPGLWDTLKANLAIVSGGMGAAFLSIWKVISSIKGGFKDMKEAASKKADEESTTRTTLTEKIEQGKNDLIRKGQLEGLVMTVETEIIAQTTKLDVVTVPETRLIIEDRIAVCKARLAAYEAELTILNARLPKIL